MPITPTLEPKVVGTVVTTLGRGWLVTDLFANGEAGTFSDIHTYATNYFTDAGTTPAEIGDPIYQINDQSGNEANWTQATATARPELSARYNLLEGTEITGNSLIGWNTNETAITTGISDPDGGTGAIKIEPVSGLRRAPLFKTDGSAGTQVRHRIMYRSNSPGSFRLYLYADQTTRTLSATTEWQEFQLDSTLSGTNYGLQVNFAGGSTASEVEIYAPDIRLASDTDQPPYQRVGDLTADPSDYDTEGFDKYLKFDLGDDVLNTTLDAGTYTVALPTREGIFFDEVTHTEGTFSIGPTSYTGGPAGIMEALATSGECRMIGPPLVIDRALSAGERNRLVRWYQARGAGVELELGPELVTNGTFDSDVNGWTPINTTVFTSVAGEAEVQTLDNSFAGAYQAISGVLGQKLFCSFEVRNIDATFAMARVSQGAAPTATILGDSANVSAGTSAELGFVTTASATDIVNIYLRVNRAGSSASRTVYYDNVSVKTLELVT